MGVEDFEAAIEKLLVKRPYTVNELAQALKIRRFTLWKIIQRAKKYNLEFDEFRVGKQKFLFTDKKRYILVFVRENKKAKCYVAKGVILCGAYEFKTRREVSGLTLPADKVLGIF